MNQQVKTKRDFPYVTLVLIVTLVLVVAILGYTFVESVGIIGHIPQLLRHSYTTIGVRPWPLPNSIA